MFSKKVNEFILNNPVEISEGNIPAVTGNMNLIPYRRAFGKTLIPFGPFEVEYRFTDPVIALFNIDLYTTENMMLVQEANTLKVYYNKLPTSNTQDDIITLATSDEITFIHSIDTPTQTIITLSDKRSFSVTKQTNGTYLIAQNTLKGYSDILQIVNLNHTYIMHRGDNTFAYSDTIIDQTTIPSDHIISALPPSEKIQRMIIVGNILYIFGTNVMVCYQGVSSFNNQLPFTYMANSYRKYQLSNSECAVEINDNLFTIGSITRGVHTLHNHTVYSTKYVFSSAINNFLNISNKPGNWRLEKFVLYDHENIMAFLGKDEVSVLYNPLIDYSALIQPLHQNFLTPTNTYQKQFTLFEKTYFFDSRGSTLCNTSISGEGNDMFVCSFQVLRDTKYTLDIAITIENTLWRVRHITYLVNREKVVVRNADGIEDISYTVTKEHVQIPIVGHKESTTIHKLAFIRVGRKEFVELIRSTASVEKLEDTLIIMYSKLT